MSRAYIDLQVGFAKLSGILTVTRGYQQIMSFSPPSYTLVIAYQDQPERQQFSYRSEAERDTNYAKLLDAVEAANGLPK